MNGMRSRRVEIPRDHPLRKFFGSITMLSFEGINFRDPEVVTYVANLLTDFVHVDSLYALRDEEGRRLEYIVDMLILASEKGRAEERQTRKHIGDYCLFISGLYPESLHRQAVGPAYYVSQGKAAYATVAAIDGVHPSGQLFRKLSDRFEGCVTALNLGKEYLQDPFYQYLLRQMHL